MRHFSLDVITGRRSGDLYDFRQVDADAPTITWQDVVQYEGEREIDTDESGVYLEVSGAFSITLV